VAEREDVSLSKIRQNKKKKESKKASNVPPPSAEKGGGRIRRIEHVEERGAACIRKKSRPPPQKKGRAIMHKEKKGEARLLALSEKSKSPWKRTPERRGEKKKEVKGFRSLGEKNKSLRLRGKKGRAFKREKKGKRRRVKSSARRSLKKRKRGGESWSSRGECPQKESVDPSRQRKKKKSGGGLSLLR